MPIMEFNGERFEVDKNRHLIDTGEWTAKFPRGLAIEDKIRLSVNCFSKIYFLRNECVEHDATTGREAAIRDFHKKIPCFKMLESFNIYQGEPICYWKYAGLPRPA
jgi:sulfur relay (sulfurtransferase) DsrC/TusE family protein